MTCPKTVFDETEIGLSAFSFSEPRPGLPGMALISPVPGTLLLGLNW